MRDAYRSFSIRSFPIRLLSALLLGALALRAPALAAPDALSDTLDADDREAIRVVIQAQLDAFRADDAEAAFGLASPAIQAQFGSPATFMMMVRSGYEPVYRNREAVFQEVVSERGVVAQKVLIIDQDDRQTIAIYPMHQLPDGSWRIDGCYLAPPDSRLI